VRGGQCSPGQRGAVEPEAIAGRACHAFTFAKYAQRYLAETQWRFNRRFELAALVPQLLVAAARIKPWWKRRL